MLNKAGSSEFRVSLDWTYGSWLTQKVPKKNAYIALGLHHQALRPSLCPWDLILYPFATQTLQAGASGYTTWGR